MPPKRKSAVAFKESEKGVKGTKVDKKSSVQKEKEKEEELKAKPEEVQDNLPNQEEKEATDLDNKAEKNNEKEVLTEEGTFWTFMSIFLVVFFATIVFLYS